MSEKVIINKVVAGWIEEAKHYYRNRTDSEIRVEKLILQKVLSENGSTSFVNNDIDIVTLAKAIQYGYEVPYEFKVGDICLRGKTVTEIVRDKEEVDTYTNTVKYANENKSLFKLICKAENREDLKQ